MKGAIEVTQRALQDNSFSRVYHAAGAGKLAGASLLILRIPAQSRDLYESAKIVREHCEVLEGFYGSFIQLKSKENPAPTAEGYERYKAEGAGSTPLIFHEFDKNMLLVAARGATLLIQAKVR